MGKKILLADDSITIQKVIELTFSDEDFDVVTVGNGRLALEKLKEVQPDIVLCDIIMPEKDGYEVCEHVKGTPGLSRIPVLLLTGAFEPFDQEKAERVGSDGFLAKPFEPETLIAKVKELLSRASSSRAAVLGAADLGVTAPQQAVSAEPAVPPPARPEGVSPRLEEVPPAVPPVARETAPPEGASLIPEEPFEAFDMGAAQEPGVGAPAPETAEPLAPVSEDELATLAGGSDAADDQAGDSEVDSASTVMFSAGQLPWQEEGPVPSDAPPPSEPPAAEGEPEPVLTPERPVASDLAEQTGAAFEEVLEEDLDLAATGVEGARGGSDTQAPISSEALPQEAREPSTFETVEPPPPPEGVEHEAPPVFEASQEEPPELELEPGSEVLGEPEPPAPVAPESPPAYEPFAPPEPEPAAPVAEPEPEVPPVYEPFAPPEPPPPPVQESAAPWEPEPPAAPEPDSPRVYEPFAPPDPRLPADEEVAPAEPVREPSASPEFEAPPVFEPVSPPEPKSSRPPEPPAYETFGGPEHPPEFEAPAPEPEEPSFEAVPSAAYEPSPFEGSSEIDRPETTLPPVEPSPPEETETAPTPVVEAKMAPPPPPPPPPGPDTASVPEDEVSPELEPPPTFEEASPLVEESPVPEPEPPPAPPEPVAAEAPPLEAEAGPPAGREEVVESFADIETGGETEEPSRPPSEAASVPVPVDMVEKIAQRVVGQVSEKVVREIAWEVIPDLAEALIKQEIARLKEELQKL